MSQEILVFSKQYVIVSGCRPVDADIVTHSPASLSCCMVNQLAQLTAQVGKITHDHKSKKKRVEQP